MYEQYARIVRSADLIVTTTDVGTTIYKSRWTGPSNRKLSKAELAKELENIAKVLYEQAGRESLHTKN